MKSPDQHPNNDTLQNTTCRLKEQGFINQHRKTIFRILAVILVADFLLVPDYFYFPESSVLSLELLGISILFLGIVGRVFATISIGRLKDREIVSSEMYSICRNPLYFSSFLMALGIGLLSSRLDFFISITGAYLIIFYPMMLNEAKFLKQRFSNYPEYESRVPLFIPNFRLWNERSHFQIDFKLVKRTFFDAFIALPVGIFVCLISVLRHTA
jgi:protein-S-isoprenylcysteine O-methyltransferase Ste14